MKDLTLEYSGKLLDEVNKSSKLSDVKYMPKQLLRAIDATYVYTPLQYQCLLNDIESELFNEFEDLITLTRSA